MLVTRPLRNCLIVSIVCFLPGVALAAEKAWIEVDSPHFRVMSNGSESGTRRIAYEFEQVRATLADRFPGARIETGAPLLIFAPVDEQTAMQLAPWMRAEQKRGIRLGGYFDHHWEKQFAMVRLDLDTPEDHQIVYHEYTHTVLHANFRWLPLWLDEGMAEFFGNTRFEGRKIYIGAPSNRYRVLRQQPLIPVDTLLSMRTLKDGDEAQLFYAESWALVHFLHFGPGMLGGEKLNQFEALLQNGTEQKKAFQAAFGDTATLEKSFEQYVRQYSFTAGVLSNPPNIDERSFQIRKLSVAETDAQLGGYQLWSHNSDDARPLIEEAIRQEPNLGLAHENMGFLLFAQGKDDEAREAFSRAYALDPNLYLSLYYKTMLSPAAQSETAGDQAKFRDALLNTLKINPDFAPACVELALLDLRQGDAMGALAAALKAEKLEPTRAGYHLLTGRILLRLGRAKEASEFARYVAERWSGPDHDEAVELWNEVPEAERTQGAMLSEEIPRDTQTVKGRVHSTTCAGKDRKFEVVIDREGDSLTFHATTPIMIGFSDTIWYGEDHFSQCYHLGGMRAIIRYRPPTDKNYAGEIVEVEYRQEFANPPSLKIENTAQVTR